jgi:hypothetical protein
LYLLHLKVTIMYTQPEFRHDFCDECADKAKSTLMDSPYMGYTLRWEELKADNVRCGAASANCRPRTVYSCGGPATLQLVSLGGNAYMTMMVDARPMLSGGAAIITD